MNNINTNQTIEQVLSFTNGVATLKAGAKPIDESVFREHRIFGKLMLVKGNKFDPKHKKLDQFLKNESGTFIRAEAFMIGKSGQMISLGSRIFLNVELKGIEIYQNDNFWFVEMQHPKVDVTSLKPVKFT